MNEIPKNPMPPTPPPSATAPERKPYEKPVIKTEGLTAVAAVCNGTTSGGRKAATPLCNASRLKS